MTTQTTTPETALVDLDKAIAATPDAVRVALQKAVPGRFTPELAEQISADVIAQLNAMRTPASPLTAAERGPAWIARYGCSMPDCALDHAGRDGEPGWHQTAGIETIARDIDADQPDSTQPFMAARVTVLDDRAEAYGRTTEVWLDVGVCTAQLTPARAREIGADMRRFADRLVSVCDRADQLAVDDHDGDPELRVRYDAESDERIRAVTEGRS